MVPLREHRAGPQRPEARNGATNPEISRHGALWPFAQRCPRAGAERAADLGQCALSSIAAEAAAAAASAQANTQQRAGNGLERSRSKLCADGRPDPQALRAM